MIVNYIISHFAQRLLMNLMAAKEKKIITKSVIAIEMKWIKRNDKSFIK